MNFMNRFKPMDQRYKEMQFRSSIQRRKQFVKDLICKECQAEFRGHCARWRCDVCRDANNSKLAELRTHINLRDKICKDCQTGFKGHASRRRCDPCREIWGKPKQPKEKKPYQITNDPNREEMILSLMNTEVSYQANKMLSKFKPYLYHQLKEDIHSEAMKGAIEAVDKFDSSKNVKLASFAQKIICGRILDFMRSNDHLSRQHRKEVKEGRATDIQFFSIEHPNSIPDRLRMKAGIDVNYEHYGRFD